MSVFSQEGVLGAFFARLFRSGKTGGTVGDARSRLGVGLSSLKRSSRNSLGAGSAGAEVEYGPRPPSDMPDLLVESRKISSKSIQGVLSRFLSKMDNMLGSKPILISFSCAFCLAAGLSVFFVQKGSVFHSFSTGDDQAVQIARTSNPVLRETPAPVQNVVEPPVVEAKNVPSENPVSPVVEPVPARQVPSASKNKDSDPSVSVSPVVPVSSPPVSPHSVISSDVAVKPQTQTPVKAKQTVEDVLQGGMPSQSELGLIGLD